MPAFRTRPLAAGRASRFITVSAARLALAVALAAGGCAPAVGANPPTQTLGAEGSWVVHRLYLGRSIPGGGTVSDSAWAAFLTEVVTPLFPTGITVLHGDGQWRDSTGTIVREASFVLERYHPPGEDADSAVVVIAAEYRRRFGQEAVMHVRAPAEVRFHEEE
jgi:hypothetical protein